MNSHQRRLTWDLVLLGVSLGAAALLLITGVLARVFTATAELELVGSFIAGVFFTSVFTAAPAAVVLGEIAHANSPIATAFVGGAGAVIGDLILFSFVKGRLSEDVNYLVQKLRSHGPRSVGQSRLRHWLIPCLGAMVIASPLPDELGLVMMGLTKMKTSVFILVSYCMNTVGILIIGLIAQAL